MKNWSKFLEYLFLHIITPYRNFSWKVFQFCPEWDIQIDNCISVIIIIELHNSIFNCSPKVTQSSILLIFVYFIRQKIPYVFDYIRISILAGQFKSLTFFLLIKSSVLLYLWAGAPSCIQMRFFFIFLTSVIANINMSWNHSEFNDHSMRVIHKNPSNVIKP